MRLILSILFLLAAQNLFSQLDPLTFRNFGTPYTLGKDSFYSQKIHLVTLNPDKTFEFASRPYISCLTWYEYKGTWRKDNDTLILSDQYEVMEEDTKVSYKKASGQTFHISFRTDKNSELKNKKIEVQYIYDYDAHLDESVTVFNIKSDNTIEIPFKSILHYNKLSAIRISYMLDSKAKRYNYLTQDDPINNKKSDVPNLINVVFVENPKSERVYRTIKAVIRNETLKIVSIKKTKTTLPDYYREIEFENNYVLVK